MNDLREQIEAAIRHSLLLRRSTGEITDAVMAVLQEQEQVEIGYLDIGAGGYLDIGTSLEDDDLFKLPAGRHALGIIGTYGIEGYKPMPPSVPDRLEVDEWFGKDHMYASGWNDRIDAMLAAVPKPENAAPMPPSVPDGFVLVPIEPTREMLFAGGNNAESGQNFVAYLPSECAAIYRDMLAAAPKPGGSDE